MYTFRICYQYINSILTCRCEQCHQTSSQLCFHLEYHVYEKFGMHDRHQPIIHFRYIYVKVYDIFYLISEYINWILKNNFSFVKIQKFFNSRCKIVSWKIMFKAAFSSAKWLVGQGELQIFQKSHHILAHFVGFHMRSFQKGVF